MRKSTGEQLSPRKIRNQVRLGSKSPDPLKIPNLGNETKLKQNQNNGMVGNGKK